ncbi:hypothetical protein DITRI_Ditri18aG0100100 [Diplodiscus trichospermus]
MSIGTCVPHVPDDEELQPGQIYFLLPLSQSHKPLSLPDLCSLAIKASSDLSSSNSNLILSPGSCTSSGTWHHAVPSAQSSAAREFLEAHNQARAAVGVAPLKWSEQVANAAGRVVRYQRNKMGCKFTNLTNQKYGGNQEWVGGPDWTPRMIVTLWVEEKKFYNYASNSCAPNHECGVYTQVVWNSSSELGCAQATCKDGSLTICFYNPPRNFVGERPY